jgi:hypothetical protein
MSAEKNRHGCLLAWLLAMIVMNAVTAFFYVVRSDQVRAALPDAAAWFSPTLIVCSAFNVLCAVALFQWKKWGFWGFCASTVVALAVNLAVGLGIGRSVLGLAGALVLFGVLQIGDENQGWSQLE